MRLLYWLLTLLLVLLLATQARSEEDTKYWYSRDGHHKPYSYAQLRDKTKPKAVAELFLHNRDVHTFKQEATVLTHRGLSVEIFIEIDTNRETLADTLTVTPPEGYIAVPSVTEVDDSQDMIVYIYLQEGVGM